MAEPFLWAIGEDIALTGEANMDPRRFGRIPYFCMAFLYFMYPARASQRTDSDHLLLMKPIAIYVTNAMLNYRFPQFPVANDSPGMPGSQVSLSTIPLPSHLMPQSIYQTQRAAD